MALKRAVLFFCRQIGCLLAAGVLGDSLCALAHGVLGQFTWEKETHGGLDFPAGDRGTLVVVGESGCLGGDPLEDVVHKAVHDRHGLARDAGVGVHLLQHFVYVDAVGFPPLPPALLGVGPSHGLCLAGRLLRSLACYFRGHVYESNV